MATAAKIGMTKATVVLFSKREPIQIDPELKDFLDEAVIPSLIREALAEIKSEKTLAPESSSVADCRHSEYREADQ
jgi:hypothetical protein